MKTISTNSILQQWQDNTTQMRNLLEQQERIITDLVRQCNTLEIIVNARNDFFVKDDYIRIAIEIKARERVGQQWPGRWHSMPMLADLLTAEIGWIVTPNSLWRALEKVSKYEDGITRRAGQPHQKLAFFMYCTIILLYFALLIASPGTRTPSSAGSLVQTE